MRAVIHTLKSRIVREEGPTRKDVIEGFPGEVFYGSTITRCPAAQSVIGCIDIRSDALIGGL
jgi:hypothetical protein